MASPRLSREARELYQKSCALLEEAGVGDCAVEFRGRHPAIVFTREGRQHRVFFPLTPSDGRTWLNMRAQLRRLVAGLQ